MSVCYRMFRWVVPVVAGAALLAGAVPAWAGTVQIQDDAHVLNSTVVQNEAATFPVGVYIWATTQDAASKSAFDNDVRSKVNSTFPIVMGINTESHHETIQIGAAARVPQNAALAAERSANSAFVSTMQSSHDYTAAVTAALRSLRGSLATASRQASERRAAQGSWGIGGFLLILLLIGVVIAVVMLWRKRRRSGPPQPMFGGQQPPMGPYPGGGYPGDYPGGYGPPARSGMGAGAAGALGAVGGGLLGYELGKMQGEEQQFRQDEMTHERAQYDSAGQGDWVVGQDADFGDGGGGDTSGGGGDW
ncbi:MAG TPA: hypothetical protein VFO16_03710 [Pseudonocardiaceae bacterium]|nr:hypothetical protein [Pseudonocardiaceae bacterium]